MYVMYRPYLRNMVNYHKESGLFLSNYKWIQILMILIRINYNYKCVSPSLQLMLYVFLDIFDINILL